MHHGVGYVREESCAVLRLIIGRKLSTITAKMACRGLGWGAQIGTKLDMSPLSIQQEP